MEQRFFGAIPSPQDDRDYRFADIPGAASTRVLPYHSDVPDIIVDQLASSQCGACAITAARYETEHRQNGNTKPLSHTYVYGSDYDLSGEGMYLRTVMSIGKAGIPYEKPWECWGTKAECKRKVKENVNQSLKDEAHLLRGTSYYSCRSWQEVCNACRVTNGSVVIMVAVYENWYNVGSDGIVGRNKGMFQGNHFVRVKDYEILSGGVLKIRCQNSWGKNWGDNGYCYLYSDQNAFSEAMCLVDDIDEVVNKLTFSDVNEDRWSKEAIDWVSAKKIMTGFEDGTFHPTEPLTREQFASAMYRAFANRL